MKINRYPDGATYVTIEKYDKDLTFRLNSYEDLWYLNQTIDVYNNAGLVPHITIPNLIDAQSDRRFAENQSSGLKLVCKFLNSMNAHFKIFHPHNQEVVEALMDDVKIMDNREFIEEVTLRVSSTGSNLIDTILMSSDAGGFKSLMKTADVIGWRGETYSASKSRKYTRGEGSKLTQIVDRQDFQGKDILIVDDICVYGGTFKGLSKLLRERNCGKLYLAVSHMTVKNLGEDPVTNYFDKVFTTNSKFDSYTSLHEGDFFEKENQPKNLEIIKLF